MCGIAGFFNKQHANEREILHLMVDSLSHRGPDASGYFYESIAGRQVALGHRRLSIIDVSQHANQPMIFEQLIIVYNGEVYNFLEIKAELVKEGYHFQTASDTEVILKAFHRWGIKSVNKFRGMFAICIFDKNKQKAFLIRDRVGVKPFYFYYDSHHFIFSSELKSLRHHPGFKNSLCEQGLNKYFQHGYITAPWTIFKGSQKISPGHYIEYDLTNHTWQEKKYWELSSYYLMPKLQISEQETIDQLQNILSDAFLLRTIADVPVGIFLSGGIDSSLIAAILQAQSPNALNTFTIGFDDNYYDESVYANEIAKYLGTHHHEKICTWKDAESITLRLPKIYDEPFADSSSIPTALLSQFSKQKVTVALSGDGGDELFCGYDSYLLNEKRFNSINKIPFKFIIGKLLTSLPDPFMSIYGLNYDLYSRYLKLKSVLSIHHVEDKYQLITRVFTPDDLKCLFNSDKLFPMKHQNLDLLNTLERMMLVDFNQYLSNDLMVKVDRASMHYSLECREPLLDHRVLEFAAQIPMQFKNKKYILKKILNKYLPAKYFERKKHGFGVPINRWLRKELNYLIRKYLDNDKIKRQNIFNHRYVTALSKCFLRSNTNDNRIWTLLVFQMWYEEYFNETF